MSLKIILILTLATIILLTLSGCSIGVGVGVETRMGYVYFQSAHPDVHGDLFLDGKRIGYLHPLGWQYRLTTLDFRHVVVLEHPDCPGSLCTWVIEPPLYSGEVIPLAFPEE